MERFYAPPVDRDETHETDKTTEELHTEAIEDYYAWVNWGNEPALTNPYDPGNLQRTVRSKYDQY